MKKILILLCLFCTSLNLTFAQLTLQKVNSKRTKTIKPSTEISVRYPTRTASSECNCYFQYDGKFIEGTKDSLKLIIENDVRIYVDENGITKSTFQNYKYQKNKEISTIIRTNNALFIKVKNTNMRDLNNTGGLMMLLAVFNQIVLSPFYGSEVRSTTDKISWAFFGVGLTFALLPNSKTYHIIQPKGGNKTLWQFKN